MIRVFKQIIMLKTEGDIPQPKIESNWMVLSVGQKCMYYVVICSSLFYSLLRGVCVKFRLDEMRSLRGRGAEGVRGQDNTEEAPGAKKSEK